MGLSRLSIARGSGTGLVKVGPFGSILIPPLVKERTLVDVVNTLLFVIFRFTVKYENYETLSLYLSPVFR